MQQQKFCKHFPRTQRQRRRRRFAPCKAFFLWKCNSSACKPPNSSWQRCRVIGGGVGGGFKPNWALSLAMAVAVLIWNRLAWIVMLNFYQFWCGCFCCCCFLVLLMNIEDSVDIYFAFRLNSAKKFVYIIVGFILVVVGVCLLWYQTNCQL